MAEFDEAIGIILMQEGGRTNDKDDPGGPTDFGISLRFLKSIDGDLNFDGVVDAKDLDAITEGNAIALYHEHFWRAFHYSNFYYQGVANKMFSLLVNMPPANAHKILQRAIRAHGGEVVEDGILGPKTFIATNSFGNQIIPAIRSEAAGYYRLIAQGRPKSRKYLKGWLNRAYY